MLLQGTTGDMQPADAGHWYQEVLYTVIRHIGGAGLAQELFCTLLQTSKDVSSELLSRCAGQLAVHCHSSSTDRWESFAAWLCRHKHTIQLLDISLPGESGQRAAEQTRAEAEDNLVRAIKLSPAQHTAHVKAAKLWFVSDLVREVALAPVGIHARRAFENARSAASAAADTGALALALPAEQHATTTADLAASVHLFEQALQLVIQATEAASRALQQIDTVASELADLAATPPGAAPAAARPYPQQADTPTANCVAAGEAASATVPRLPLRSFRTYTPSLAVLQALPVSMLTRLELRFGSVEPLNRESCRHFDDDIQHGHTGKEYSTAVGMLTSLRNLSLFLSPNAGVLLAHASNLTNLVDCEVRDVENPDPSDHLDVRVHGRSPLPGLPASLQSLRVSFATSAGVRALPPLTHLTALTSFSYMGGPELAHKAHVLQAGDVLPESLQELTVLDCDSTAPLLNLPKLRKLCILECSALTAQLQQLQQVTSLQEVQLLYHWQVTPQACVEAWGALPLSHVKLVDPGWGPLPQAAVSSFSMQDRLQILDLAVQQPVLQQLTGILHNLTALQQLRIAYYSREQRYSQPGRWVTMRGQRVWASAHEDGCIEFGPERPVTPAQAAALVDSIVQLRQLLRVCLVGLPGVAAGLPACTQLTRLEVVNCAVDDASVVGVAGSLRQLKVLSLNANSGVTDSALPPIVQQLQYLTDLRLVGTAVTEAGVAQLSSLKHLRCLETDRLVTAAVRDAALRL